MSGFEWFLVIVVVILVPLAIAVVVTLWTLEQARRRNPRNRPGGKASGTKRKATRPVVDPAPGDDPSGGGKNGDDEAEASSGRA